MSHPWAWAVGLVVLSLIPLCLMGLGVNFSSAGSMPTSEELVVLPAGALADATHAALRGSFTHTLLEWTAVCAATFVALLAFVHFRLTREALVPIIGVAIVCAGGMDAFHTFAADRLIHAQEDNRSLIPFT